MAVFWINNPFDHLPAEGRRPQRYTLLCRALAARGHRVVWWSSDFNHAMKKKRNLPAVYQEAGGFEARLIPTRPYASNLGPARILSHHAYAKTWKRLALKAVAEGELEKPDLVLTSLPPLETAGVARIFRKLWGCKAVVDIMDAWPETFHRLIPLPEPLRTSAGRFLFAGLHRNACQAYRLADAVTAVGRTYLKLASQYGCKTPMHLCYHGIARMTRDAAFRYTATPDDPLRLVYAGNMGRSYDLETVIKGVVRLVAEGAPVRLDLAGTGPEEKKLRQLAQPCKAIRFPGYLTNEALAQLVSDADVGLIPMIDSSWVAVPYKLADYAAAGLAVLNSLSGETRGLLDRYGAGSFYQAGKTEGFCDGIRRYLERPALLAQQSLGATRLAKERFMMDQIYPSFVSFLEHILRD